MAQNTATKPSPERTQSPAGVGDLATIDSGDRIPCDVIAISKSGHRVTLRERGSKRCDDNGLSESQSYMTYEDPDGRTFTATRRKDGAYRLSGWKYGGRVSFGQARRWLDYTR